MEHGSYLLLSFAFHRPLEYNKKCPRVVSGAYDFPNIILIGSSNDSPPWRCFASTHLQLQAGEYQAFE